MAVTKIQDLKKYMDGVEVELPGFVSGEPFNCRLRRPSLLAMVQDGSIPNPLLSAAGELFREGTASEKALLPEVSKVIHLYAKASLMEPTYDELKEAGITLTDTQLVYMFNYGQTGVDSLARFRKEQAALAERETREEKRQKTKRNAGD